METPPPATFRNPIYALVAIGVSFLLFVPAVRRFLFKKQSIYDKIMLLMDSLGLGIFTAVGIETALLSENSGIFLLIFVGMITGTGGGVIRDVLAGNTPYILVKHFMQRLRSSARLFSFLFGIFSDNLSLLAAA